MFKSKINILFAKSIFQKKAFKNSLICPLPAIMPTSSSLMKIKIRFIYWFTEGRILRLSFISYRKSDTPLISNSLS